MRKSWFMIFSAGLAVWALTSCTANAPNDDGVCKRTCGGRVIGGGKIRAVPLSQKITYKNCTIGSDLPAQNYRFLVYEDTTSGNASSGSTTGGSSGDTTGADTQLIPTRIPKAGISFTPIAPGITIDSAPSEWCTDSCGIAEVKFTPVCLEQDIGVGIIVPGMLFDDGDNTVPSTQFVVTIE